MPGFVEIIFQLAILLFSVVIHEVSHGYAANALNDPTAKYAGRLTLNPAKHLDPFGSFLFPFMLYIISSGNFVFGWAKPVPYNPYNLKWPKWGPAVVGAAGPLSNLAVAVVFGIILHFVFTGTTTAFSLILSFIVYINILLAVFNLIPIPPLDGSKILFALLPPGAESFQQILERYGFIILIFFIFFGFSLISPLIYSLFKLITGISLGLGF